MTLQEFYDLAISRGATPDSELIVEYCSVRDLRVDKDCGTTKIFID